ncbi:D-alanyl-D-alanine carboxypeptidase [Streptomyces sp. CB00316]|uniref:D-alanyl-D-alanine carboxypeptidase/D-alanyl-D-alanine endopeptidase n=1 Tax=unclassified Streptomyces TaxID=2593676 RepID=UPI00093A53E7|nr:MULTISPECIES: D-alanyl-D-alanine carboxypeptidase/D-alanyl-D-alanine-endopeptidase [unclassified Streptomyces]MBT2379266.1 D-alanyl-D-alanine carboxypeptidase/D-alanyl-D-alanine-endopeptidase [Streptomyces sp. ISL-111]MBT2424194.1 D-alanyl-D-alanine carboxypeptidase/D-alanyl-D-alanine-endopeptidase [Streptomyces sp. ISL-112]MBT2461013.1 D-alanyl-D-alanine carboxypeptidase/D-alanyl-D-alanine-endopeptidase [Streptomyces sp. ISL-63]OKJ22310.1 D-alanyl-D-alanine carboxypeptidase [Streptomyces sp
MAEPVEEPSNRPSDPWGRIKNLKSKRNGSNTWQVVAGSAVLGLVVATGAVLAAGPWDNGQRKAERQLAAAADRTGGAHHGRRLPGAPEPAPSAPAVLGALDTAVTRSAPQDPAGLRTALAPLIGAPALGTQVAASVIDTATGEQLYGRGAATPMTPASTVKIATTTAALSALGPDHRIATTVRVSEDHRTLTLVGGGDPTLSKAALRSMATEAATALREGENSVRLAYDTSRYTGPERHPIGKNPNIAPVTALMVDEGRLNGTDHGHAPRTDDPAGDAARAFAAELKKAGVEVSGAPHAARAADTARTVATHHSAPLSALVERALTNSDNDIAEALARQTAIAKGESADFAGARRAVTAELRKLDVPTAGARLADGSGLDREGRVTPALLTALLARAADPERPGLRPVLTGLPVAGFNGTLSTRYRDDTGASGLIRAKTGTLTGVNSLAGTVVDPQGRLLAFAFLASGSTSPSAAESALDALAAALAGPGG